jgi:hypothetical protein
MVKCYSSIDIWCCSSILALWPHHFSNFAISSYLSVLWVLPCSYCIMCSRKVCFQLWPNTLQGIGNFSVSWKQLPCQETAPVPLSPKTCRVCMFWTSTVLYLPKTQTWTWAKKVGPPVWMCSASPMLVGLYFVSLWSQDDPPVNVPLSFNTGFQP